MQKQINKQVAGGRKNHDGPEHTYESSGRPKVYGKSHCRKRMSEGLNGLGWKK